ncbi:MAG: hypothetical protein ACUVXD_01990 [Thermodesulfobacteriota bacterium]
MRPKDKKIAVLISGAPHHYDKAHEILRMTLGLTLRNREVYLFLLSGAVGDIEYFDGLSGHESHFTGHLEAFLDLGCPVIVEKEVPQHLVGLPGYPKIQTWSLEEIALFVSRCQVVVIHQVRNSSYHWLGPVTGLGLLDHDLTSRHKDQRGFPIRPEDPSHRILHLSIRDQGVLFREVILGQARRNTVTVVLSQDGSSARGDVRGDVFEAISNDRGGDPGKRRRRIDYENLLDLIFQHETVICW